MTCSECQILKEEFQEFKGNPPTATSPKIYLDTSDMIEKELESTIESLEVKILEIEEKLLDLETENVKLK